VVAPDGSTTMDKIVDTTDTDTHLVTQAVGDMSVAGTTSFFVKAGEYSELLVAFDGPACSQWVDISGAAPVFGTKTESTGTINSTGYEDFGGGIWRIWINATKDAATSLLFYLGSGSETSGFTGTGSSGLYLWGVQVELVSSFPTSYIATTTTSVTRNKDDVLSADASWYNADEGSIYCAASQPYDTGVISMILNISDNTLNGNVINLQRAANDKSVIEVRSSGSPQALFQSGASWTQNTTVQLSAAYKVNDFEMYMDGARSGTGDQSGAVPVSISNINIGSSGIETQHFNGHVSELIYWDERFADSILAEVSLGDFGNTEDQVFIRKKARDRFRRRYRRT
jgi:hypothetical protein